MYNFMQHAHVWWHNKIKETGDFKYKHSHYITKTELINPHQGRKPTTAENEDNNFL